MSCDFFFLFFCFFFFKQKTAYVMRISDWSSDVCSSDLSPWKWRHLKSVIVPSVQSPPSMLKLHGFCNRARDGDVVVVWKLDRLSRSLKDMLHIMEIGRAWVRERVCQYV